MANQRANRHTPVYNEKPEFPGDVDGGFHSKRAGVYTLLSIAAVHVCVYVCVSVPVGMEPLNRGAC